LPRAPRSFSETQGCGALSGLGRRALSSAEQARLSASQAD
jgi:hypothetical protein